MSDEREYHHAFDANAAFEGLQYVAEAHRGDTVVFEVTEDGSFQVHVMTHNGESKALITAAVSSLMARAVQSVPMFAGVEVEAAVSLGMTAAMTASKLLIPAATAPRVTFGDGKEVMA